jgi:DNA-binding transcriptional MerR regulator/catechol 2,3-dioxygenase-like lactoylglutathione lyase family enzyme
MFKIREFSTFTRVSVKMLRHYDELGLLRPVSVDPLTGYRYYSSEQLPRLNRIIALKDLGFSLQHIAKLLEANLPVEEIRGMFRQRRAEIEQQLQIEQERLMQLDARLRQIENGKTVSYDIVARELPTQLIASIRHTITDEASVYRMFEELEAYVAATGSRAPSSPLAVYHDDEYHEDSADVEVAVPLTRPIPAADRVMVRELLGAPLAACVVYTGGYEQMGAALNALLVWVETNRYAIAGPLREVYLRFGADRPTAINLPSAYFTDKRELFVTELQLPVEPQANLSSRRPEMNTAHSSTQLTGIAQIAINVHDVKRAIEFYRDTLGMRFLFEIQNAAFFDCGGIRLMLGLPEKPEFDHPASIIYYNVADIHAMYELLLSRGVRFENKPHIVAQLGNADLWLAAFRDINNNLLALMSQTPRK